MRSLWKYLVLLPLALPAFAQPPAPIEWGEARWANLAGWPGLPQITTLRVIPMGDTLLFTALNVGSPVSDTILVCSSFDNGQTFTPWQRITQGNEAVSAQFAGSAGRYYAFFSQGAVPPDAVWLRTSDDGGLTWSGVQQYRENVYAMRGFASGDEVLAKYGGPVNGNPSAVVIRSTDRGQSWSAPIVIDTADFYMYWFDQTIAFTTAHCLILERPPESHNDYRFYVARGDSSGQNWTTFQVLPGQNNEDEAVMRGAIAGDTASEVAGVLAVFGYRDDPFSAPLRPRFHRTTDGGESWGIPVNLTTERWVIPPFSSTDIPANICNGKLWLVGWEHMSGTGWNYLGTRFSANHGKNWYPVQMAADSVVGLLLLSGQIRGNQIDLYWAQGCNAAIIPWDYRMVTGTITPDTIIPVISVATVPSETVRVGQRLQFAVTVTDNDTLSEVRLAIAELSGDTARFGMARGENSSYHFSWRVPDSGYYHYWFEAEDWWENVGTLPDSGSFHFATEGWSSTSSFIPHPSSFLVSVFPNPCNTWPSVTLSPDWLRHGPVEITVYNALGQEVIRQTTTSPSVPLLPEIPAASGIYLLQVTCRRYSALQKFVVLK